MNAALLDEIYVSMTETKFDIIINKILEYFIDKPILLINIINIFIKHYMKSLCKSHIIKNIIVSEYYVIYYTFFTEKWDNYLTIFIYKIICLYI